ncbi:MAG: AMP-binding protein, partial [Gaiellaceae bacterium]|nr:AMP-binding protein [Gaiellaceae bacterium]
LEPALVETYRERWGLEIVCGYGQAETGVVAATRHREERPRAPGEIGEALPGHHLAVVDADGSELPPGVEGVLAVRGRPPTLFAGYWDASEETKRAFHGDWYLTGDIAVAIEPGVFRFLARAGELITSRGRSFAPYEVEQALAAHPAVVESAVVGMRDLERGGQFVRAFVVLEPGIDGTEQLEAELRQFVGETLPEQQVPREIEFVEELPRSSSGALRRLELRERPISGRPLWELPPTSEIEPAPPTTTGPAPSSERAEERRSVAPEPPPLDTAPPPRPASAAPEQASSVELPELSPPSEAAATPDTTAERPEVADRGEEPPVRPLAPVPPSAPDPRSEHPAEPHLERAAALGGDETTPAVEEATEPLGRAELDVVETPTRAAPPEPPADLAAAPQPGATLQAGISPPPPPDDVVEARLVPAETSTPPQSSSSEAAPHPVPPPPEQDGERPTVTDESGAVPTSRSGGPPSPPAASSAERPSTPVPEPEPLPDYILVPAEAYASRPPLPPKPDPEPPADVGPLPEYVVDPDRRLEVVAEPPPATSRSSPTAPLLESERAPRETPLAGLARRPVEIPIPGEGEPPRTQRGRGRGRRRLVPPPEPSKARGRSEGEPGDEGLETGWMQRLSSRLRAYGLSEEGEDRRRDGTRGETGDDESRVERPPA